MVARTAGGREVAGFKSCYSDSLAGHGRWSDPSAGLKERDRILRFLFFYVIGNFVPITQKTFREDVQLAVRYNALHTAQAQVCGKRTLF